MQKNLVSPLFALLLMNQIAVMTNLPKNSSHESFIKISREQFNDKISDHMCTESNGIISPEIPHITIPPGNQYSNNSYYCEPIQVSQLWTSLISLNMLHKGSIAEVNPEALKSVDPTSVMIELVNDAVKAHQNNPSDWKEARQVIYRIKVQTPTIQESLAK